MSALVSSVEMTRMSELAEQASFLTDVKGLTVEEALRQLGMEPDPRVVPGAYVETRWGEAVVIQAGPWVSYRYEATRTSDEATLWVANSDPCWAVHFGRPGDEHSAQVLTRQGPYGI